MRLKLFLCALLFCAITKAQTNNELKDFITKNSVAIKGVQKNMIRGNNSEYITSFKDIVKNQEAAVKLSSTDQKASFYFASIVRTECLKFLKTHTQGSTEYFEISSSEKDFDKSSTGDYSKVLSSTEIKTVDGLDAMNPQSLNNLILTIQ